MKGPYTGSCLCGRVQLEVDDFEGSVGNCYCSMCRKFHGAAYATIASVSRDQFRWLAGEDQLAGYTAGNGTIRTFCKNCGSSLTFYSPRGSEALIEVALGVFDLDVPVRASAHIFVGSAANWVTMAEGEPQYEAGRDSPRLK